MAEDRGEAHAPDRLGRVAWGAAAASIACFVGVSVFGDLRWPVVVWPLHEHGFGFLGLGALLALVALIAGSVRHPGSSRKLAGFVGLFTLLCGGCLGLDHVVQLSGSGGEGRNTDGSIWRSASVMAGDSSMDFVTFRCDRFGIVCVRCGVSSSIVGRSSSGCPTPVESK